MRVLLDFRGLALHCYFAGRDPDAAETQDGEELRTIGHTVDNFVRFYLLPLCAEHSILDLIAVHDGGSQYRKSIYPSYKEKRSKKYSEEVSANIHACVGAVEELCRLLGILSVSTEGVEADDVIAWLCEKLPGEKRVYTRDKDLIQLASGDVKVFYNGDEAVDIVDKAGNVIDPQFIALYKSIVCDKSDEYPGVPGVGPAGYRQLAETFNEAALDRIVSAKRFDMLEGIDHPVVDKLLQHRDLWHTCHRLARLHPEEADKSFRVSGTGKDAAYRYRRPAWVKRLPQAGMILGWLNERGLGYLNQDLANAGLFPEQMLVRLENRKSVDAVCEALASEPLVSIDFETVAPPNEAFAKAATRGEYVDVYGSEIVGMGLTFGRHMQHMLYFAFGHKEEEGYANLPLEDLDRLINAVPAGSTLLAHNCLFERTVLKNTREIEINSWHDTMTMCSHVDEDGTRVTMYDGEDELVSQGLKDNTWRYLQYKQAEYRDVVPEGQTMADVTAREVASYGADDPLCTVHLYHYLKTIQEIEGTWRFMEDCEFPASCLLSEAFLDGVTVDWAEMARLEAEDRAQMAERMGQVRAALEAHAGDGYAAGVENVFREESQMAKAKGQDLGELRRELEGAIPYRPYVRYEKQHKFDVTPGKLGEICKAFGLPPLADLKPATIRDWAEAVRRGDRGFDECKTFEFVANLQACSDDGQFTPKKRGAHYKRLRDLAYDAWKENLPEDKRYVWEGSELNIGSPKQMGRLMYGTLNLPYRLYNPVVSDTRIALGLGGAPQTDKDAVADAIANVLAGPTETAEGDWRRQVLLDIQGAQACDTRIGLFYEKWPLWRHPLDGQVHPGIRPCGTKTRRPSSSSPNVLQLPKRGEGVKVRKAILPNAKRGHDLFFSLDIVQQELVLLAGQCKDPNMMACYASDPVKDIHSMTTSGFVHMSLEEFDERRKDDKALDAMRTVKGKGTNFLKIFGGGKAKLARKILAPEHEAQAWLDAFDARYPGVQPWKDTMVALCREQGYLTDLLGNRIHVYDRRSGMDQAKAGGVDRQTISKMIQGLAASMLKRTLGELMRDRTFQRYDATFSFPLYDEIAGSCRHEVGFELISEIHAAMTREVPGLGLPMRADISIGLNFGAQVEIGRYPNRAKFDEAIEKLFGGAK